MHGQVDRFLTYWSELSLRRSALLSSIVVLVMLIGVPGTVQLYGNLHTDLRELLPKGAPAAVGLDELEKRLGGLSHLTVVVRTEDFAAGAKFVDALVVKLKSPTSTTASTPRRSGSTSTARSTPTPRICRPRSTA
jgi:predicted RND superfamily exporter protein